MIGQISFTLNGRPTTVDVEPAMLVAELLRERLNLTGTHIGCDTSQCGACVVHLDGLPVKSCTLLRLRSRVRRCSPSRGFTAPPVRTRCIRCRKRFASITVCNAAFAPPAC